MNLKKIRQSKNIFIQTLASCDGSRSSKDYYTGYWGGEENTFASLLTISPTGCSIITPRDSLQQSLKRKRTANIPEHFGVDKDEERLYDEQKHIDLDENEKILDDKQEHIGVK